MSLRSRVSSLAVQYAAGAMLAEPSMGHLGNRYEPCGTVCGRRNVGRAIYGPFLKHTSLAAQYVAAQYWHDYRVPTYRVFHSEMA